MKILDIELNNFSYQIIIENNIFERISTYHLNNYNKSRAFIITDTNVGKLYLSNLKKSFLAKKIDFLSIIVKSGESSKSFHVANKISERLISKGIRRQDIIYALGGGVVGDLSGFLASIVLRGIRFVQIPTTLLSQVDSSVGGKTGINTSEGKNLIGTFHQPSAVFIDPMTLSSLPKDDFIAGYAEVIKYALINDKRFFNWLNKNKKKILILDMKTLKKIIFECCCKKSVIVSEDEKETGKRVYLNLGHTFAHAIEYEMQYKVMHGKAVALGILMAMKLSYYIGALNINEFELVKNHIKEMNLPTTLKEIDKRKDWSSHKIFKRMKKDKKVINDSIRFILCKEIGDVFIKSDISKKQILKAINDFN